MFVQIKKAGGAEYIYVIETCRNNGVVSHRTVKKLGRLDRFLEKDPEALEKLREEVRRNSNELRSFSTAGAVAQLQSVAVRRYSEELQDGMPTLNYSSFVLKSVWNGCLKLDYRFQYLQSHYYSHLKNSLNQQFFEMVLGDILKFENTGLMFGIETAIMSSNFNPEDSYKDTDGFFEILGIEAVRILKFIYKRMCGDLGILADDPALEAISELLDKSNLIKDTALGKEVFKLVSSAVVTVLKIKIVDAGINADFNEIQNSLRRAVLLVNYPVGTDAPILYIKANNGHYVRTMNSIMKALGLSPLLNIQDKIELSRRLRTKFTSDDQIIPRTMYERLINIH